MKTGVFGGSFDPIHMGHLILAESCREQAGLDRVLFIPTAISPLKKNGPKATDRQRVEMLQLAIGGHASFELSEIEIDRGDVSFTVDTLEALRSTQPDDDWYFLMGSDSLAQFDQWHQPQRICELAIPLIVARRGSNVDLDLLSAYVDATRMQQIASSQIEFPWIEISGTEIRQRIQELQSIRFRVPRAVEKYIETNQLYAG